MKREFPEMPIAAAAAVIVREGKIFIIKRRFPPNEKKWSIPGGVIEIGEPVREAAVREVREETGLDVRIDGIVDVVDNIIYEGERVKYHFINCDFQATYLSGEVTTNEEVSDFAWMEEGDLEGYDLTTGAAHVIRKVFAKLGERRD
jgi:ADP-ribose pyrophosphatase YjhB (NUDIX family)